MAEPLINYVLKKLDVANPDGTVPTTIQGGTVVTGPGDTILGKFPKAVDLGLSGKGSVVIGGLPLDLQRFTLRIAFNASGPVVGRQNLMESDLVPCSLFLTPRFGTTAFDVVASVAPKAHGWRSATTRFTTPLQTNTWHVADLAYDIDTLGIFVDGQIVAVHAFPSGRIVKQAGSTLYVGTWVDGARDHFNGAIAALSLYNGIPDDLESQLDARRGQPEWFITHKVEAIRPKVDLGEPTAAISWRSSAGAYLQAYDGGELMYHDGSGVAFEMHGAIRARYDSLRTRAALGYLVSDEVQTTKPGGRKSVFSSGAIYWSGSTGAVPVVGQLYLDYEALAESAAIGFPTKASASLPGGAQQEFQGARMYFRSGAPRAHEVHGAILAKYLAVGGPGTWGFPLTNESDLRAGAKVVGKYSQFEGCTIYWSSATGAFEVHGDIRRKYGDLGGPTGQLGFPISDEKDIPGVAGAGRYSVFQNGSLLWYGSFASIITARPFTLFIGRINSKESEGFLMGQNDLYVYVQVRDGSNVVFDKRIPHSGDLGGHNVVDINLNIPVMLVPDPSRSITFSVDVHDADPFSDDNLGKWTKVLNAANGWGLGENGGILDSGSFSKINSITASVKPKVDASALTDVQKWWGVKNRKTDDLSYGQYASAFSDVDSERELWDVSDWLEKAFYELVVKDIAEGGNCFGMSLEAIYARKGSSLFSLPLDRFTSTSWNVVKPQVNVKHAYQVGAGPIWWFLQEFVTGNTHNPKEVFARTRDAFAQGNNPVLCITQNYDFSGEPHVIMPVAWDDGSTPWRISICDPNFPGEVRSLTVDPNQNTYMYDGGNTYQGGAWSGGRLHYMPFSLLSTRQRTPIWDAILLLLAGTIIILGDDAQTVSITDPNGVDLDAHGKRATAELRAGRHLSDFFVSPKGYNRITPTRGAIVTDVLRESVVRLPRAKAKGVIAGEILARMPLTSRETRRGPAGVASSVLSHLPIEALTATRTLRTLRNTVISASAADSGVAGRTVHGIASDPAAMRRLDAASRSAIRSAVQSTRPGDFRHKIAGLRQGSFDYAVKHGLNEFRLGSTLASGEATLVEVKDLGSTTNTVEVRTDRDKQIDILVSNKLGVTGDRIQVTLRGLPAAAHAALQLNLKPGLGGMDLLTAAPGLTVPVEVEATIDGRPFEGTFTLPLDGGIRLKVSSVLSEGSLGLSRIDRLFGPARDMRVVTRNI